MTDLEKLKELLGRVSEQIQISRKGRSFASGRAMWKPDEAWNKPFVVTDHEDWGFTEDAARLITETFTDLPALIAELEAARDKIDALESELSHYREMDREEGALPPYLQARASQEIAKITDRIAALKKQDK